MKNCCSKCQPGPVPEYSKLVLASRIIVNTVIFPSYLLVPMKMQIIFLNSLVHFCFRTWAVSLV